METRITKKVNAALMEKIFDKSELLNIRYYNAVGISENDYQQDQSYNFEINIRHPEGTDAKKLFAEEVKKFTPVWSVEILFCTNAGNPAGRRQEIAADTAEIAYNQLHDKVKNYKYCMKINGGTTIRI